MTTQSVYGEVFTNIEYAWPQEFGTGIRRPGGNYIEIVPKVKKALAFHMEGVEGIVIAAKVMHPGVPATHFMSKSVNVNKLIAIFTTMVVNKLKKGMS